MSGYILCQIKRADMPYYIDDIGTNIYSIEELCFYLYHNIYLLDDTILNESLCQWIYEELKLKRLSEKLYTFLEGSIDVSGFCYLVFKEIQYLTTEEFHKWNQEVSRMLQAPKVLQQKKKGDALIGYKKYADAIGIYQKALRDRKNNKEEFSDQLGNQFLGSIWHNMGCAYANLFQMDEAIHCFEAAYEQLRTLASIKSCLYATYMEYGMGSFEEKARQYELEEKRIEEILDEIERMAEMLYDTQDGREYQRAKALKEEGNQEAYEQILSEILTRLTAQYHHSAGY